MKRERLAPYLIIAFLIHAGIFIGLYQLNLLPAPEKPVKLVPVEVITDWDSPTFAQVQVKSQAFIPSSRFIGIKHLVLTQTKTGGLTGAILATPAEKIRAEPSLPVMPFEPATHTAFADQGMEKPVTVPSITMIQASPGQQLTISPIIPEQVSLLRVEMSGNMVMAKANHGKAYQLSADRLGKRAPPKQKPRAVFPPYLAHQTTYGLPVGPEGTPPSVELAALKITDLPSFPFPGSVKESTFLMVVDTSGSVKGAPLKGIKKSARSFINLMGPRDLAGIITFDDTVKPVRAFTVEKEPLQNKIDKLRAAGSQSVLYDALLMAIKFIRKTGSKNKFIVLFSDGKDEGSQATFEKVISALGRSDISILAVGYSRVEKKYLDVLSKMAAETGGIFVHTPQFQDLLGLYRISRPDEARPPAVESVKQAFLKLNSQPLGAAVFVNGELKGKTPLLLPLTPGKYEVLLSMPAYYDWRAQITLNKAEKTPVNVRLLPVNTHMND